jgi:hypothetical protein
MEKEEIVLFCFEVGTTYKSGRFKKEIMVSKDESSMWACYDKHHNKKLIESSVIVDMWQQ